MRARGGWVYTQFEVVSSPLISFHHKGNLNVSSELSRPLVTENGGIVYPAVNKCVYCGSNEALTNEHIVPFGLHGDLLLPQASCQSCQKITSGLERFVLKDMLGMIRTRHKYRSSNRRKKRKHATATISVHESYGSIRDIKLEHHEFPIYTWTLPIFGPPGLTWQEPYHLLTANDRLVTVTSVDDVVACLEKGGGTRPVSMPTNVYHAVLFQRFIAKVAHSFACAVIGLEKFEPILQDFIIRGFEKPRIFIGGELKRPPIDYNVFEIGLGTMQTYRGKKWIVVRFRLLSYLGAPVYTAVVGECVDHDIFALDYAAYAKPIKFTTTKTYHPSSVASRR